jgi:hypothetical protein
MFNAFVKMLFTCLPYAILCRKLHREAVENDKENKENKFFKVFSIIYAILTGSLLILALLALCGVFVSGKVDHASITGARAQDIPAH